MIVALVGLGDIVAAIADELQLSTANSISVSRITVTITNEIDQKQDFINDWYEEYLRQHEEDIPF